MLPMSSVWCWAYTTALRFTCAMSPRSVDGPEELSQVVLFGTGQPAGGAHEEEAAVTLSIAKRPGTNAIAVADTCSRKSSTAREADSV